MVFFSRKKKSDGEKKPDDIGLDELLNMSAGKSKMPVLNESGDDSERKEKSDSSGPDVETEGDVSSSSVKAAEIPEDSDNEDSSVIYEDNTDDKKEKLSDLLKTPPQNGSVSETFENKDLSDDLSDKTVSDESLLSGGVVGDERPEDEASEDMNSAAAESNDTLSDILDRMRGKTVPDDNSGEVQSAGSFVSETEDKEPLTKSEPEDTGAVSGLDAETQADDLSPESVTPGPDVTFNSPEKDNSDVTAEKDAENPAFSEAEPSLKTAEPEDETSLTNEEISDAEEEKVTEDEVSTFKSGEITREKTDLLPEKNLLPASEEISGDSASVPPTEKKISEKKKNAAIFKKSQEKKSIFGFLKKKVDPVKLYNFNENGPLVEPEVPEGYSFVDEYWISEGRSKVLIVNDNDTHQNEYMLFEPVLSEFELELLERLFEDMRDVLILTDEEIRHEKSYIILEKMGELLKEYKIKPEGSTLFKLQYYLMRNFLGWSKLDPLLNDPFLEDISCDGSEIPVFLYHRKYRNVKTNVVFHEENLYSLAITLAQRSGKHISISQPMLDATLPDGSRLQLTLGKEVTSRGTSFTIRKFREDPFTPVELMEYGTFSAEELVFFWLAIENNKSLLFVGGTASGKTSSLNAVSLFIPPLAKVVSIEDTREITLFHDNWIASVTRESVVESTGSKIDMFDLLKAAMRQRPEYILVGEVRGVEAQTLFQAMNTGHTTFSTLHANNVDAAIHRLENAPLNVPRNMVQALDVVSVQALVYRGQERVRRSMEIVEIAGIDPGTGNLRVNNVFEYDPVSDVHSYTGRSGIYRSIMEMRGWSAEEMSLEAERRLKILKAMHSQEIRDYVSVTRVIQAYAINPDKVMSNIDDLKLVFS